MNVKPQFLSSIFKWMKIIGGYHGIFRLSIKWICPLSKKTLPQIRDECASKNLFKHKNMNSSPWGFFSKTVYSKVIQGDYLLELWHEITMIHSFFILPKYIVWSKNLLKH